MSKIELHKKGCSERPKARLQKQIGVAHLWPRQRKVHSEANRSVVDRFQWVDLDLPDDVGCEVPHQSLSLGQTSCTVVCQSLAGGQAASCRDPIGYGPLVGVL